LNKNVSNSGGFGSKKAFSRTSFQSLDDAFKFAGNADKFAAVNPGETALIAVPFPAVHVTDVYIVASEALMLALPAHKGDIAKRTDILTDFILSVEPATVLGNWVSLYTEAGKVQTSVSDPSIGYLVAKLEAGIAAQITEDTTNPLNSRAKIDVRLGTQTDQAAAGSDSRFCKVKVTATDTTPDYLENKIWIDNLITLSVQDPAGDAKLKIGILNDGLTIINDPFTNLLEVVLGSLNDTYIDPANIDGTPVTPSMRTLGTLSDQAAAGNDSRLSNDRTPTAHAFAGAIHSNDSIANLKNKINDGTGSVLITCKKAEYSNYPNKTAIVKYDKFLIEDFNDQYNKKEVELKDIIINSLGTLSDQAAAGNDSRLSNDRTPTAHAFAGSKHTADTIANIQTKVSDGSLITTAAAEINALTAKGTPTTSDLLLIEDAADSNKKKKITIASLPVPVTFPTLIFFADQLDNPVTADWKINALAPADADVENSALTVRRFNDTTEQGIGFYLDIPAGATNIIFTFKSGAFAAPAGVRTVGLKIYNRDIPDNAAVTAWSAGVVLTDVSIPTNVYFQYDTETKTLASLGLTTGKLAQFELTRIAPTAGTNLVNDWELIELQITFS